MRKKEFLAKSQNARRASFLRRKLRDVLFRDGPMPKWFPCMAGCSREQLRDHIESMFTPRMNWGNHGRWHVDYIVPRCAFAPEDKDRAFHYTNLRPMWGRFGHPIYGQPAPRRWIENSVSDRRIEISMRCGTQLDIKGLGTPSSEKNSE